MRALRILSCHPGGFHHLAFTSWGDVDNPRVLVCAHGLTRNSRDFDYLARQLEDRYRVVCLDFPGRGMSDWLDDKNDYNYSQYLIDATVLFAHLRVDNVSWLGTSMGGILGMMIASMPDNPINSLILNDVGPFVPRAALERIARYLGQQPVFESIDELEAYIRKTYAGFGPLSDEQWHHLAVHGKRNLANGKLGTHYDPGIAIPLLDKPTEDIEFWAIWDRIQVPILTLRGESSDLLLDETAQQMRERGPGTELRVIRQAAHAPALMSDQEIGLMADWLQAPASGKSTPI